jgi:predicted ATPase
VALGRELRHPDSLAFAWLFHGWIRSYRRDRTTCIASAETGIAIAREAGSVQTLAWNRCVRGWALAHVGEFETGVSELSAGIDTSKAILGQVALPQFIAMMAEMFLLAKQPAAAESWLMRAIDFEHSQDDRYFAAEVRPLSAVCLAARGETEGARSHLDQALEISRSQGATMFELRAALTGQRSRQRGGFSVERPSTLRAANTAVILCFAWIGHRPQRSSAACRDGT